jgi:hypothetical protein
VQGCRAEKWKPGCVPGFFCLLLLAGCGGGTAAEPGADPQGVPAQMRLAGRVADKDLDEISGMAQSLRNPHLLWVHNDSGDKARLYAIDDTGAEVGRLSLKDADNDDWEDMASFALDGEPYLLVADIGNNETRRDVHVLYVVAEPDLSEDAKQREKPAWRIEFRYPDGPRDAEAVAVDPASDSVFIISKRDLPPVLYRVPLHPAAHDGPVTAERVQSLDALPRPSRADLEFAPVSDNWYWQPTAMDFAPDGRYVVVLTYGAVYYFPRNRGASIGETLARAPLAFSLRNLRKAEAMAVGSDAKHLFVTVEKRRAPLIRIDLSPPAGN